MGRSDSRLVQWVVWGAVPMSWNRLGMPATVEGGGGGGDGEGDGEVKLSSIKSEIWYAIE